jgi:hypothetical protein
MGNVRWRKRAFGFDSRRPAGSVVVSLVRVQGFPL